MNRPSAAASPESSSTPLEVHVKGKQLDVGDSLRGHVQQVVREHVGKYFANPLEANVVFSREGNLFHAHISVHAARGILLESNASAADPYPAFDEAASRMASRLRRYKKRLLDQQHHANGHSGAVDKHAYLESVTVNHYVLNPEQEDSAHMAGTHTPLIVAEMTAQLETLTVSEAVMKLDLADMQALLFYNRGHGGLNMVYRRADGNIGWVDPGFAAAKTL